MLQVPIISLVVATLVPYAYSYTLKLTAHCNRLSPSLKSSAIANEVDTKKLPTTGNLRPSIVNLAKNAVGAGVFSIHSRVATNTGVLPISKVCVLVYGMALWATYNFYTIGETCRITQTKTYSDAWAKAVSEKSRWIAQAVVIIAPIVGCTANIIVLSDILKLLFKTVGLPLSVWANRNMVIAILSTFILYPLCIQSNLNGLKFVSVLGLTGHISAVIALLVRSFQKSYSPGGAFYSSLLALPVTNSGSAPRYYAELEGKESQSQQRLLLPFSSYMTAATIYVATIVASLALFGSRAPVFALNGFATCDPLGTASRVCFGISVLASYPLMFLSMRNWFVSLAQKYSPKLGEVKKVTVLLLAAISFFACLCTDIGVVGSIAGGLLGNSMMFVLPPIMYMRALYKQLINKSDPSLIEKIETGRHRANNRVYFVFAVNTALLLAGAGLGIFGTYNSVLSALTKI
ncbi:unnamed protein product [Sphagnum jensenii]|uniref:Amino acid transporter transmembrane domain-containing protein n=1 Tax=Sphagnum jensenii TaxID=128206 RepID=A0ABP0VJF1_9BRYO